MPVPVRRGGIIGTTTACEVDTPHWADAFAALEEKMTVIDRRPAPA